MTGAAAGETTLLAAFAGACRRWSAQAALVHRARRSRRELQLLREVGFAVVEPAFRWYNFALYVAVKSLRET